MCVCGACVYAIVIYATINQEHINRLQGMKDKASRNKGILPPLIETWTDRVDMQF